MTERAILDELGQINPTLSVLAYFTVPVNDDIRRTRLPLQRYPDVAAWLMSFLNYILYKQGKLPGEQCIAEPPDGNTRELLIEGQVILAGRRPDGGLALRLNPGIDIRLQVDARRSGLPALNTLLGLAEEPAVTRWLLSYYVSNEPGVAAIGQDQALRESLRRYGVLVDEPPAGEAWFPDPVAPADLAGELAPMGRVFLQRAGQPVPEEVRQVLGRHTPALPPDKDLVWGQDAGTGMVYPSLLGAGVPYTDVARIAGQGAQQRAVAWAQQCEAARVSVRTRRFAVLRDIVPVAQREKLRHYVRQLKERGYFPELGDGQVKLRSSIHNEPTIASLHNGLAGIVNSIGEEPVVPSYCFLSCYEAGSVLEKHLDRPQCAYNVCLVLDMQYLDREGEPDPWPIYLELDGQPQPALLGVGDGVFFSGKSIWHWRDALPPGQRAVVCFNHFVTPDFTGSLD